METKLSALLAGRQDLFLQIVREVAGMFPDITGVLAVGSLVHQTPPADFYLPRYHTAYGLAYERIRNPNRRRLSIRDGSDLDIWICVRDTAESAAAQEPVERSAIALLSELASGTISWGSVRWRNKKQAVFGQCYKNRALYPDSFVSANGSKPWMAEGFKKLLEQRITEQLPDFVRQVNRGFEKQIPGDFLEIRAFPESLFHLRPDDTVMPNMREDRMPFPRVADDQWLGPEHSSFVLYTTDEITIYPFKKDGRVLGRRIADQLAIGFIDSGKSHGALVIKPDAIRKGQLDIIMAKITDGIASFGGRVVAQKRLRAASGTDIAMMYPLLTGRELQEAKDYLVGGEMIILIIESDLPVPELFKRISMLKGPRLIDRTYERLVEGRTLYGSIRDLLPVPGEEEQYKAILQKVLAKKADPSIRFSDEEYRFYAQNLIHSPDNEMELQGLLRLVGFDTK